MRELERDELAIVGAAYGLAIEAPCSLSYVDEDVDKIQITTDDDLAEALAQVHADETFRVFVRSGENIGLNIPSVSTVHNAFGWKPSKNVYKHSKNVSKRQWKQARKAEKANRKLETKAVKKEKLERETEKLKEKQKKQAKKQEKDSQKLVN
ncbi:MAG: hypothetical protein EZS28_009529 [Streblomastix strix]|uniref:PB1 domain-containing protein n=1 Tax=Streblomastix strix TaxID=222440 RepID=A0A5J4WJC3_9EUKA|nr:MAG: hypothetical protein EZS28_009529 [Streblomastix strix]